MADIVLINPRFEISYWGLEHAMPFLGVKAILPVANLPLLAALTPAGHKVTLVDENIEPIDFARCARANIVGVTGMNVQRERMKEILDQLKRRGAFTVVGGPWVTVNEDDFAGLADVIFIGEAEQTWPRFLNEWGEDAIESATSRPSGPTWRPFRSRVSICCECATTHSAAFSSRAAALSSASSATSS